MMYRSETRVNQTFALPRSRFRSSREKFCPLALPRLTRRIAIFSHASYRRVFLIILYLLIFLVPLGYRGR